MFYLSCRYKGDAFNRLILETRPNTNEIMDRNDSSTNKKKIAYVIGYIGVVIRPHDRKRMPTCPAAEIRIFNSISNSAAHDSIFTVNLHHSLTVSYWRHQLLVNEITESSEGGCLVASPNSGT
jgi:hypothetical protein